MPQKKYNFTVDAKLLEELGERLVGQPHIALAELVKNAYDADATFVEIEFDLEKKIDGLKDATGEIVITDDGHGMSSAEFEKYWMRIGTTHKANSRISKNFNRQLTGSKGVGRLSVQFLAHKLELITVSNEPRKIPHWLQAEVDWDTAVKSKELTQASVSCTLNSAGPPLKHGTKLTLRGLKRVWSISDLKELAGEIWWLQPPFRNETRTLPLADRFEIRFKGNDELFVEFKKQLDAILRIQSAKVTGTYINGTAKVAIEFWANGTPFETKLHQYTISEIKSKFGSDYVYDQAVNLNRADFEFRIYNTSGRQKYNISVDSLRNYLERFYGVHVYDGPFRLPYYGKPENDWLKIENDHAQRKFVSDLLPEAIQEAYKDTERLRYLPTMRRIIGTVKIQTSREPNLDISITRDRLIESKAYYDLISIVRYSLDLYAYYAAKQAASKNIQIGKTLKSTDSINKLEKVLLDYRDDIPPAIYRTLEFNLQEASKVIYAEKDASLARLSVLAPLATAGISALALQHELRKQFGRLDSLIERMTTIRTGHKHVDDTVLELKKDLSEWLFRARTTNQIFDYMTADTIHETARYRALPVVEGILKQLIFMSNGVNILTEDIDPKLYLPKATFAEWGAIFQNILSNSFNSMMNVSTREISILSESGRKIHRLYVQDTGTGVDLSKAESYFQPFERAPMQNNAGYQIGLGGTGVGLTIVRLLCDKIGCLGMFVPPGEGYSTAFCLEWKDESISRK